MANEKRLIDLTGQRFGKLVVIEYAGRNERRESLWRCVCDCGNESIVRGDVLRRGTTESCGCGKGLKHGHHKRPWYSSYKAMMERCYLKSSANYQRYGGKGISVCDEWHDINKFAEWVEVSGYAPGLTIDRIDPAGNYEPNNCQWLTRSENSKKSHTDKKKKTKEKERGRMNKPYIYYKEQCDYCLNKGKCDYEKRTRKFVETISGVDSLTSGVFGSLSFKCDYFDLDQLAYNIRHPAESEG